jgi:small conductance mechanosensitive channel
VQNLIRDFISGFFILLENQYNVGDVIRAAGVSGQVEDMSLRITVLRDLEGVAHFIPNGEIKVVSKLAKEWSRAVVNVGVAYQRRSRSDCFHLESSRTRT